MSQALLKRSELHSLQDAKRAFARSHICEAARELFYRQGYEATTFEQIAAAAGTRRTTLYSHFRDKAAILQAIGDDYYACLCLLAEELPGPVPNRLEIDTWIATLVAFVVRERTPATLLIGLGIGRDKPELIENWSLAFLRSLAKRIPAFGNAVESRNDNALARAWAKAVLRELSLSCLEAARQKTGNEAILAVAGDLLERFVREHA